MYLMALVLFFIGIGLKRLLIYFKNSPFSIIWLVIIITSFLFSIINGYIRILPEIHIIIVITIFLLLVSLLRSFKKVNIITNLTRFSKSSLQNRYILFLHYIKRAVINNVLLILFSIISFDSLVNYGYIFIMLTVIIISIFLSFLLIYQKHHPKFKHNARGKVSKLPALCSPQIKSILYDYFTSDFLITAILSLSLFTIFMIEIMKDIQSVYELEEKQYLFMITTIILCIGFAGIIDSIKNINWKFQAMISPNNFKYHIKRTSYFLFSVFGLFILFFVFIGAAIDILLLLKFLFCLILLFFISIFIAFTTGSMLIKGIILILNIIFSIWITTLPIIFLAIIAIPFFAFLFNAKNEYREWYLT